MSPPGKKNTKNPPKSSGIPKKIIIVFTVIIIAALIGFAFWQNNNISERDAEKLRELKTQYESKKKKMEEEFNSELADIEMEIQMLKVEQKVQEKESQK